MNSDLKIATVHEEKSFGYGRVELLTHEDELINDRNV